jgi:signal transduction histidine kinase
MGPAGSLKQPQQQPQRSAAETAALEARLIETLLTHSNDVFCCCALLDCALVLEYVSPSARRVLGWAPEALLGSDWLQQCHPDDVARVRAVLARVVAPGAAASRCEYVLCRLRTGCDAGDGGRLDGRSAAPRAELWMHVMLCRDGPGRLLSMARSAAGHKTREEALRGFLLVTSHDLRTPVHSVSVAAQLLRSRPAVAAHADATALVDSILAAGSLLLTVISNVLAMRDVDAGGVAEAARRVSGAHVAEFDPRALLADTLRTCRLGCGAQPEQLRLSEEPHEPGGCAAPEAAQGDAERISHVALNLLMYALQHRNDATAAPLDVRLGFQRVPPALLVRVHDASRQLRAPEAAEALFAVDSCAALGLFVARSLARAAGGDVTSEAPSDGGVPLLATLPVAVPPSPRKRRAPAVASSPRAAASRLAPVPPPAAAAASPETCPPPAPAPAAPRVSCLLIEDNALNLLLVRRLLERHGFEVRTAQDGLDGLQQMQASVGGAPGAPPPPQLVLTDLRMPRLGGVEMARQYREWCGDDGALA